MTLADWLILSYFALIWLAVILATIRLWIKAGKVDL